MSTTSKSPRKVARVALDTGRRQANAKKETGKNTDRISTKNLTVPEEVEEVSIMFGYTGWQGPSGCGYPLFSTRSQPIRLESPSRSARPNRLFVRPGLAKRAKLPNKLI